MLAWKALYMEPCPPPFRFIFNLWGIQDLGNRNQEHKHLFLSVLSICTYLPLVGSRVLAGEATVYVSPLEASSASVTPG